MKTKLLHLIFCVCAFHLAQVQSACHFIHTDGREYVDEKNCLCGPEKIPNRNYYNSSVEELRLRYGQNSNSPKLPMKIIHSSQDTSSISAYVKRSQIERGL